MFVMTCPLRVRSPSLKEHAKVHGEPSQQKQRAENSHNGKRAPGMAKVFLAVIETRRS
jgi:hypothetical protein